VPDDPVILMPGEGERIAAGGAASLMKAVAATTGGAFSMSEVTVAPGFPGPPLHLHRRMTDSFFVLEGTLRVVAGDREADIPAGGYALVPPGVPHTFSNPGDTPVRLLNLNAPGGWEDYLRELAAAMPPDGPPDPEAFRQVFARYDVETVEPGAPAPPPG
jgi:mannose-6-phosphate isomerase-like protein (cupin superfamily)